MLKGLTQTAPIFLVALLVGLTSCAKHQWCVEQRCFDNEADALSYNRSLHADTIDQIEPLLSPIGQSAVIIIPSIEEHERMIRAAAPNWSEDKVREGARLSDADFVFGAELIQHWNIFGSTEVLRQVNESNVQVPSNGYIAWFAFHGELRIYMRSEGQSDFTPLNLSKMKTLNYVERHRYILKSIEDFVRSNAPHT